MSGHHGERWWSASVSVSLTNNTDRVRINLSSIHRPYFRYRLIGWPLNSPQLTLTIAPNPQFIAQFAHELRRLQQ